MTIHIHHPAPLAHHTAAVAAATAALLVDWGGRGDRVARECASLTRIDTGAEARR